MSRNKLALLVALFLLLVFVAQGILFIRANSQTIDEAMHLAAGYSYLAKRDFRIEPAKSTLHQRTSSSSTFPNLQTAFQSRSSALARSRWLLDRTGLTVQIDARADRMLALTRFPNLFLGAILVALIGWWAYRLWGNRAAMLAMALASLEPNFVAHSSLVTTDIGVSLLIFLTVYLFWEYMNQPTWGLLVATGIATGMALLAKFSAVLVIPMIALIVAVSLWTGSEPYVLVACKTEPKQTETQTPPISSGPFAHIFSCRTDDSVSLLFSRISTLAIRLRPISDSFGRRPPGLFLRGIFFAQAGGAIS